MKSIRRNANNTTAAKARNHNRDMYKTRKRLGNTRISRKRSECIWKCKIGDAKKLIYDKTYTNQANTTCASDKNTRKPTTKPRMPTPQKRAKNIHVLLEHQGLKNSIKAKICENIQGKDKNGANKTNPKKSTRSNKRAVEAEKQQTKKPRIRRTKTIICEEEESPETPEKYLMTLKQLSQETETIHKRRISYSYIQKVTTNKTNEKLNTHTIKAFAKKYLPNALPKHARRSRVEKSQRKRLREINQE